MSAPRSATRPARQRHPARAWRWVNALLGAGLALLVAGMHASRQQQNESEYRSLQYRTQLPADVATESSRQVRP